MSKKKPVRKAPTVENHKYKFVTEVDREHDYLQVICEDRFVIRIDGEFRGPYSPDVRRMVIRMDKNDRRIVVESDGPATLNQWNNFEDLDPVPVEFAIERVPTLSELVASLVKGEIAHQAQDEGKMSFEEFDDLGPEEDFEDDFGISPFEVSDMQEDFEYVPPKADQDAPKGAEAADDSADRPVKGSEAKSEPPESSPPANP